MRSLSSAFISAQKQPARKPLVKLEVATFGHPAAAADAELLWSDFTWERLTSPSDSTPVGFHAVAIPGNGSLCRIRMEGANIRYQRVTSPGPGSDWSTWTNFGSGVAGHPVAIAALDKEVIAFCDDGTYMYYRRSTDYGATFGGWTALNSTRPCERGLAAAFKSNGDVAIVHASDANDPKSLYLERRISGSWPGSARQISGDYEISALAMYHDGDWNIIALMLDGSYLRLCRGIYGDGDQYSAGTFSGWQAINSYTAKVSFQTQLSLRQFQTKRPGRYVPTYLERVAAVNEMRISDTLGMDDPFLCYHASLGAVLSFTRENQPWFYRLKTGTEFKDSYWDRAYPLTTIATYGLSLACDGTYLYAAAPNQVWRAHLPGDWSPPAAGSGAGTFYTVPTAYIVGIREKVASLSPSTLKITLDNSRGYFNVIGSGSEVDYKQSMKRGSQVKLSIGYRTTVNLLSVAGYYFIDSISYQRKPGEASMSLHCIDAWGLLERYAFTSPVAWNVYANTLTAYQLIEKLVQAVGGSLSYVSRSTDITTIYPRVEVHTGENAAHVLREVLSLVPDVIYFVGLSAKIIYPQASDTAGYSFRFPNK